VERLEEPDQPLLLAFEYIGERYSSTAGNFLLVRLPWVNGLSVDSLLTGGPRQRDLELGTLRGHLVGSVRLTLPEGNVPQELQPEVRRESPWGFYRFTYRVEGSVLHAEREFKLTPLRVEAKEFASLIAFLRGASGGAAADRTEEAVRSGGRDRMLSLRLTEKSCVCVEEAAYYFDPDSRSRRLLPAS
jgi:hypothetical protein